MFNAKYDKTVIDGTYMEYISFGNGKNNLLIIPGLSEGLTTLNGKASLLASQYRIFSKDFTVYMFSRKNMMPDGYSIRDMAADQARVLLDVGINKTDVLGVSEGGMIAQYLAADHPEMIGKLVLAVTAPAINDTIRECLTRWTGLAKEGKHKELMTDTAKNTYSDAYLKKMKYLFPFMGFVGKPKDYSRFFANADAILNFDASEAIRNISCPTLIICGAKDKTVGAEGSYILKENIPDSELFAYPEYGHGAFEEAKDFNERVYTFLSSERES